MLHSKLFTISFLKTLVLARGKESSASTMNSFARFLYDTCL